MTTATELLRLVVHEITAYGQVTYKTLEQIENLLAAEPEAEPVAWWFIYSDGSVADGQSYESEDDCVEAWAYEIESGLGKPEPFFRHPSRPDQEEDESIAEVMVFPLRGDERERRVDIKWKGQPVAGPLYTRPEPARKPMTEDAEDEAFNSASIYAAWLETENRMLREAKKPMTEKQIQLLWWEFAIPHSEDEAPREIFTRYTRAIEKHHGIGVDDE